ncbi:MAG: TonB terminal [Verrucomicrobiota bacterium]|jgi:TonB family protein
MNRLQKKCALASVVLHTLLVLVLVFGAAFQKKPAPIPYQRINVIPSRLVDSALSGGGGNPNLARSDDQVKGTMMVPQPPAPVPPAPKPPEPRPTQPTPAPAPVPTPRIEARRPEPRPEPPRKPAVKPADVPKPATVAKPPVAPKPQLDLVPTVRNNTTKAREKEEAALREAARQDANLRREIASKLGQPTTALKAGFESGTKVDVGGPGGEAYANYSAFVQAAYDAAWRVLPDLASENYAVTVEVSISRAGRVTAQRIVTRSSSAAMDRSVQNALDKVKRSGLPPFPDGARDDERTFTIEFNLKAKRLLG